MVTEFIVGLLLGLIIVVLLSGVKPKKPRCLYCGGSGIINTFDGQDTGSNSAEYWPGPCPYCSGGKY